MSNVIWAMACVGALPEAGVLHTLVGHTYQLLLQVRACVRVCLCACVDLI